jgi:hypothetical protein
MLGVGFALEPPRNGAGQSTPPWRLIYMCRAQSSGRLLKSLKGGMSPNDESSDLPAIGPDDELSPFSEHGSDGALVPLTWKQFSECFKDPGDEEPGVVADERYFESLRRYAERPFDELTGHRMRPVRCVFARWPDSGIIGAD